MYSATVRIALRFAFYIANIWFWILLTGCTRGVPTVTPSMSAIPEAGHLATLFPTAISTSYVAVRECILIQSQIPRDVALQGNLLLYDPLKSPSSSIEVMNLSDNSRFALSSPDSGVDMIRVSPSGQWVAYFRFNKNNLSNDQLVVQNFTTNSKFEMPWNEQWDLSGLTKWISDDELQIAIKSSSYPLPLFALNPFTQVTASLSSTYPDQTMLSPLSGVSPIEFDASLRYAVYPAEKAGAPGFSLFDRTTNNQIAFFPSVTLPGVGSPTWSPDGRRFVFISRTENQDAYLSLGTVDGAMLQLLNFSREVGTFIVQSFKWSPNGRYVAIVVRSIEEQMEKVILLDTDSGIMFDPCITTNYGNWTGAFSDTATPIWSPDSRFLIVEDQTDYEKNKVILIDVPHTQSGVLAYDVRILGWLLASPK